MECWVCQIEYSWKDRTKEKFEKYALPFCSQEYFVIVVERSSQRSNNEAMHHPLIYFADSRLAISASRYANRALCPAMTDARVFARMQSHGNRASI